MTMPPGGYDSDETPRLAEIARVLNDFRSEFRESVRDLVRRDVYEAQRDGLQRRVEVIENERRINKNLAVGGLTSGLAALGVALILAWLKIGDK